jgi:hypothetical protein
MEQELKNFLKDMKKLKPKKNKNRKPIIGSPVEFRKDIGFSNQSDSLEGSINPGIVQAFQSAGIKKKDVMGDPEVLQFLIEVSSKYSGDEEPPKEIITKLVSIIDKIQQKKRQQKQYDHSWSSNSGTLGAVWTPPQSDAVPQPSYPKMPSMSSILSIYNLFFFFFFFFVLNFFFFFFLLWLI